MRRRNRFAVTLALRPARRHHDINTYFANGHELRGDDPVEIAGVQVGRVTTVRIHPDQRTKPVEVDLRIETPYELKIPRDSVATVGKQGLLGGAVVLIELGSSTSTISDGGELMTQSGTAAPDVLDHMVDVITKSPCAIDHSSVPSKKRK